RGSTSGKEEMGLMRGRIIWLAGLLAAGVTLAPASARAQHEEPVPARAPEAAPAPGLGAQPDLFAVRAQPAEGELRALEVPVPLGHNPATRGGLSLAASSVYFRQNNPLQHQPLAFAGFIDADGSLPQSHGTPGTHYGTGNMVLDAKDAGGP